MPYVCPATAEPARHGEVDRRCRYVVPLVLETLESAVVYQPRPAGEAFCSAIVRNVIEYRGASTPGMLCSQTWRGGPDIIYSERGSASSVKRSHFSPWARRKRNLQGEAKDRPNTSSKCGLSRCQPMPTPVSYSVQSICRTRVDGPPNASTCSTIGSSHSGIGAASCSRRSV